jgi:hypothetical protein
LPGDPAGRPAIGEARDHMRIVRVFMTEFMKPASNVDERQPAPFQHLGQKFRKNPHVCLYRQSLS